MCENKENKKNEENNSEEAKELKETMKAIEKAKEKLEQISNDEHEKYLAELREKYIRDQYSIEAYGYDRGKEEKTIEIARKLLEQNVEIEVIKTCTGLSEEEIKALKINN